MKSSSCTTGVPTHLNAAASKTVTTVQSVFLLFVIKSEARPMLRASWSLDQIQFGKETCLINSKTQILFLYIFKIFFLCRTYKVSYILFNSIPALRLPYSIRHALSQRRCTYIYVCMKQKNVIHAGIV